MSISNSNLPSDDLNWILPILTDKVRPALNYPTCQIEVSADDPVGKDSFTLSSTYTPLSTNPDFNTIATSDNPVYKYSYQYEDETKTHYMWQPPNPAPVASLKLRHKYNADVNGVFRECDFDGTKLPAFVFDFRLTGWLMVDYNTNANLQGTYFDKTVRMTVGFRIDSQTGNLVFVKKTDVIDNNPSGLPMNELVKIISAQHIFDYVRELTGYFSNIISGLEQYSI
jgi:hypothetical protein